MRGALLAAALAASVAAPAAAQSLLDRPDNVAGDWVGNAGTLYFHFVHRFTVSDAPARKVSNFPTFLFSAALPRHIMVGAHYATNSQLAAAYPNEWEFFLRHALLLQDEGAPLDLAGQVGYNIAADGVDGQVSIARRQGALRAILAARIMSDPYVAGRTRFAGAVGGTLRLSSLVALAADVASLANPLEEERVAWSAGVHLAIPLTPHTFSIHAANTNNGTLQGVSRGGDDIRYGFEFTVPLTLRRWFGANVPPVADVQPPQPAQDAPGSTPPPPDEEPRIAPSDSSRGARPTASRAPTIGPDTAAATTTSRRPAPARPQPPRTVRAAIRGLAFAPARIEIAAGSTIEWQNDDAVPHTVTADDRSFDSGMIQPGATWRRTFERAGTYPFFCAPHPFMKGVVVVK